MSIRRGFSQGKERASFLGDSSNGKAPGRGITLEKKDKTILLGRGGGIGKDKGINEVQA